MLSNAALWGEDLTRIPGLAHRSAAHLAMIEERGMRGALEALVS
ncbi:hypothetical protein [Azospirillum formosense]